MAYVYYPGCKYTAHSPVCSKKLTDYLQDRFGMTITGCCSKNHQMLSSNDTAVFVCPTCCAILQESAPQAKTISIWEILVEDDQFPWPDYQGKEITIQDCWRTFDDRSMQEAIRKILGCMNLRTLEIEQSYDKADFCGVSLLKPPSPRYQYLAPVRFLQKGGHKFTPLTEEEQQIRMREHCSQYQTDTVVCYCTGCLEGIQLGGAEAVHLMDLVMGRDLG